jgi:ubiquinol-cytochrome c reductase cytochrome b subunit
MYKLVYFKDYRPTIVRPNEKGKITVGSRIRSALSRIYFEDRISPVSKTELSKAQSHDHSPAITSSEQDQLTR